LPGPASRNISIHWGGTGSTLHDHAISVEPQQLVFKGGNPSPQRVHVTTALSPVRYAIVDGDYSSNCIKVTRLSGPGEFAIRNLKLTRHCFVRFFDSQHEAVELPITYR
jgi:hypothetical protein